MTRAPSHRRLAVETSLLKSTCPGVSMRLIMKLCTAPTWPSSPCVRSLKLRLTALLSMVMPRSCSSSRESR